MADEKPVVSPDARMTLPMLRQAWDRCTRCSLGEHRENVRGQMVFGEGTTRGIVFVGQSPGVAEEREGRPFVGRPSFYFRRIMEKFKIRNYYLMNLVACRSCAPVLDSMGQPKYTQGWPGSPPQPRYKDESPNKTQLAACAPRFYEELYLVDPLLIVAMGQPAAEFLAGRPIKITKERGEPEEIVIPGAGSRAVFTDKKKEWVRKVKGQIVMPTEQNQVRYLMIPTIHPAFVALNVHDESANNPFERFAADLRFAKRIYDRMQYEQYGLVPEEYDEQIPYEIQADPEGIEEDG